MAHFARIGKNNIVEAIHTVNNEVITENDEEKEQLGIDFLKKLHGGIFTFVQTSYNGNFRKNYAGIGYTYDKTRDAFIAPRPFASWTLDEDTCKWKAPVDYPTDGKGYGWDEEDKAWIIINYNPGPA
tara:strand:+ start:122 stop:502 length:381 start_codon:yes stop_codon:yes gene_type:complete